MMENKEPQTHDGGNNSDSSENSSHEEWTIIDDNCTKKDDDPDNHSKTNDQGLARSIEVITPRNDNSVDDDTGSVIAEKNSEDSDGISIITESEAEQLISDKKFGEINSCRNHLCRDLKIYDKLAEKTTPQAGTILNVVIACFLAAIVGLGAGRILGMDDKCPITSGIDFSTIKMESDMLINQIRELSEIKDVLDEIKSTIPRVEQKQEETTQRRSKSQSKRSGGQEKPSIISDTYIFDPDMTILEQLQNSLNTLCTVIDEMHPEDDFIKSDTMRTQNVVTDLIQFKKIIHNVVKELDSAGGQNKEIDVLKHAEKRIRNVCESLLNDFSYTIHGMTIKIHHKLNKVRHKLNKRLCMLKNSESKDGKIFKVLEENDNSFLESCDRILNMTLKSNPDSMKISEKKKSSKQITKKIHEQTSSESEDDVYPRDSSSESSMPDLSYNFASNNSRQKKPKGDKKIKLKSGRIVRENDSKRRKIASNKFVKTSRGRSRRRLLTEAFMSPKTCPMNQEYWLESISIYPEVRKLDESLILNKKPLYSSVVKSDIVTKTSVKDNIDNGELSPIAIGKFDQGFRASKKESLTEAKHDVTPAETSINDFETAKKMKDQLNIKIQKPLRNQDRIKKDEETLWREEILETKYKQNKQSFKHCKNEKKYYNDSDEMTESSERHSSSTRSSNGKEYKKNSTEKNGNKKPNKVQKPDNLDKVKAPILEDDISFPSKSTGARKERRSKKHNKDKKVDDGRLAGDWQLQRSRAREMYRDHDQRSEWFFDRADSRHDARKNMDIHCSGKSFRGDKCEPILEESIHDEDFYDHWQDSKRLNRQKYSNIHTGFGTKKPTKMHHRKNIMQSKRS